MPQASSWYWKVRIYRPDGHYGITQVKTDRVLSDIDVIQDFYFALVGAKMLLEGMSEQPFAGIEELGTVYNVLFPKGGFV